jgi:hypothetical protein
VVTLNAKNFIPGHLYFFLFKQDSVGGRTLAWGTNTSNGSALDPEPNSVTVQSFMADASGVLRANLPATWTQYPEAKRSTTTWAQRQ